MEELRTATETLRRRADIATWLRMADAYISQRNKMGDKFVLPRDHEILAPIISSFATDMGAFGDYIRALRDATEGAANAEMHELYRVVSVRALQVVRRTRLRKAVKALTQTNALGEVNYEGELRIGRLLEQSWGEMRMAAMADERSATTARKLNAEDRRILLDAFWKDIDTQIEAGSVPLGELTMDDLLRVAAQ